MEGQGLGVICSERVRCIRCCRLVIVIWWAAVCALVDSGGLLRMEIIFSDVVSTVFH